MTQTPIADPGSFRDPLSRVYVTDDDVLRGFTGRGADDFALMENSGFLASAVADGAVIPTERVDPSALPAGWDAVVRHERLSAITYPYEWSFSMLQDAALLQLRLSLEALEFGLLTKDATPYNVQFRGAVPVFIDLGSFERVEPGVPWYGYRQFCEQFLNPLLLQSLRGVPFQPWLRGSQQGIPVAEMARLLSLRNRFRRGVLSHVTLHAWAERRNSSTTRDVRGELQRAGFSPALITAQLRKLTRQVKRLKLRSKESTWSDYTSRSHYSDADLEVKESFVADVVEREPRDMVWDLGANDGRFSRIAARTAGAVLAIDADHLVVDRLYRELRLEGNTTITPLAMDLIDSSPSQGWRGRERASFWSRTSPDVILALALVHHLAIGGNIPIPEITAWLHSTGAEVVVEVPHNNDPMVQRLLRAKRADLTESYQIETFDHELVKAFDVREKVEAPSGMRTLYHLVPRS